MPVPSGWSDTRRELISAGTRNPDPHVLYHRLIEESPPWPIAIPGDHTLPHKKTGHAGDINVVSSRQHLKAAYNRARESTPRASSRCGVLESAWSPDAQKSPRGVHRRPNRRLLSLLFLVEVSVSD